MLLVLCYFDAAILIVFFELCDYFCSIFDSSFSFFLLSLLVSSSCGGRVRIVYNFCLVTTLGDWLYVVFRLFWLIFLITGITCTSFVVPRKILSFLFHPIVVPFFFARCRQLALSAALALSCWIRKISILVVYLIYSWIAIAMTLSCFADELVRCFVGTDLVLFAPSLRFWLQHHGLMGPIEWCFILSSNTR